MNQRSASATAPENADATAAIIRERYARAATEATTGARAGCDAACGTSVVDDATAFGSNLYLSSELDELPDAAILASLGCGNPVAVAELRMGETVLDLGSGGGIDVLLSARRVGPTGFAYGVDLTSEMIALARANALKASATNVEFLEGSIEAIPLPDASIDVVISNCVVNLASDKTAALREIRRVLRPGGRIGISDVVAENHLSVSEREARGSTVGCIAGALTIAEYEDGLRALGFDDVSVTLTHEIAPNMHGAIVSGVRG